MIVRESTEGLFASLGGGIVLGDEVATDTQVITRRGTERVVRAAFELARRRGKPEPRVTCVDKANILRSFAFFRKVFDEVAAGYPDVAADHLYVDAAALELVRRPERFDVIVTENLLGDILSDLAAGPGRRAWAWPPRPTWATATPSSSPATAPPRTSPGRGIANPWRRSSPCACCWITWPDAARRLAPAAAPADRAGRAAAGVPAAGRSARPRTARTSAGRLRSDDAGRTTGADPRSPAPRPPAGIDSHVVVYLRFKHLRIGALDRRIVRLDPTVEGCSPTLAVQVRALRFTALTSPATMLFSGISEVPIDAPPTSSAAPIPYCPEPAAYKVAVALERRQLLGAEDLRLRLLRPPRPRSSGRPRTGRLDYTLCPGEIIEEIAIYRFEPGKRDRQLQRLWGLEENYRS